MELMTLYPAIIQLKCETEGLKLMWWSKSEIFPSAARLKYTGVYVESGKK